MTQSLSRKRPESSNQNRTSRLTNTDKLTQEQKTKEKHNRYREKSPRRDTKRDQRDQVYRR